MLAWLEHLHIPVRGNNPDSVRLHDRVLTLFHLCLGRSFLHPPLTTSRSNNYVYPYHVYALFVRHEIFPRSLDSQL